MKVQERVPLSFDFLQMKVPVKKYLQDPNIKSKTFSLGIYIFLIGKQTIIGLIRQKGIFRHETTVYLSKIWLKHYFLTAIGPTQVKCI